MADFQYMHGGANAEAFPLCWPSGWPRCRTPERARFGLTFANARDELVAELSRMGAKGVILSTNIPLRRDGLPYAGQREPADAGVAVYFQWKGKPMTFACDRWDMTKDNIRAIGKTIEALRGIERWGASDMMERAFSAFVSLPPPGDAVDLSCWSVLGIQPRSSRSEIDRAYRELAKEAHPDRGGSREAWDALSAAYEQAKASTPPSNERG